MISLLWQDFLRLVSSSNFPVLNRQDSGTFPEQFRKAAGGGVTDHLSNLPHGEIRVDEQVLRLAHAAALNILCDTAPKLSFETVFEFALTHTGDIGKALERNIKGIVIRNITDYIVQPCQITGG